MQPVQRDANSKKLTFTGAVIDGQVYALVVPIFRSWSFSADVKKPGGEVMLAADTNLAINSKVLLRKNLPTDPYKLYSRVEAFQKALDPYQVHLEISY